jgi:hypothetical protein
MKPRIAALLACLLLAPLAGSAQVIVTGSLTHEYEVKSGGSYEGSIDVMNPGDAAQDVKAYQTDYSFTADGKVLYGSPGSLARSNAGWMTLSPRQVKVPAGETVTIRFTITVPTDETMSGTYWSVIMIEPIPPGTAESGSAGQKNVAVGVSQVLRYAVQVVTHIGITGTSQLRFAHIQVTTDGGRKLLVVDTENTGERWLRGTLWADIYDAAGKHVGKYDGGKQRMYPGTSVRYAVDLSTLPGATYKALIVVDCGGDNVFGANTTLSLP